MWEEKSAPPKQRNKARAKWWQRGGRDNDEDCCGVHIIENWDVRKVRSKLEKVFESKLQQ